MDSRRWGVRRDLIGFQVGCLGLALVAVATPLGVARALNNRALASMVAELGDVPTPEGAHQVQMRNVVCRSVDGGPRLLLVAAGLYRGSARPWAVAEWYRNRTVRNPVDGRRLPVHVWCAGATCPVAGAEEHLAEVDQALGWGLGAAAGRPASYVVFVEAAEPPGLDIRGW